MAHHDHHHFGAQAFLFVLLVLFTGMLVSARDVSFALDSDLVWVDPAKNKYFTPASTSFKSNCTYYGSAFTPRKSGRPDFMVLSISEGPTYNFPRGLQVLIYNAILSQNNGFVPAERIAAFRVDKTQFIKMDAGVGSGWEQPVLAIDLSQMLTESDRFDFLEGQSYFIAMQVSSPYPYYVLYE